MEYVTANRAALQSAPCYQQQRRAPGSFPAPAFAVPSWMLYFPPPASPVIFHFQLSIFHSL
jgi:hypothetical protein